MKEIKYYAVPLGTDDITTEDDLIEKATELGYVWNIESFKEALESNEIDIKGMWIKILAVEGE